jgi:hypothetical protein
MIKKIAVENILSFSLMKSFFFDYCNSCYNLVKTCFAALRPSSIAASQC